MAVAAVVRLPGIAEGSLWLDELAQVFVARSPIGELLEGARGHTAAAPLDYFGTKVAIATVGRIVPNITLAAHVWPFICGVATVVATWGLTWELSQSRRAAIAAALLTAASGFLVFYSQEARFYSMAALMAVVSLWAFARALRLGRARDWLAFAVVAVMAVYTYYFVGLLLAMEGVALVAVGLGRLARQGDRKSLADLRPLAVFTLVGLLTLAAFIPWYLFAVRSQLAFENHYPSVEDLTPQRLASLLATLLAAVPRGGVSTGDLWSDWFLTSAVVVFAAIGAIRIVRSRPEPGLAMAGFTIVLIPLVWWIDTRSQYFISERQFIVLIPPLYVMAGAGFDSTLTRIGGLLRDRGIAPRAVFGRVIAIALVAALVLVSVAPLERVYAGEFRPKEDWRSASAFVAKILCPDGRVYSNVPEGHYYGVTLYAPQLAYRATYLLREGRDEFLLDVIKRYPITTHDVIVIFPSAPGVFVPGRGGVDVISMVLKGRKFSYVSFSDDRIRVLFSPHACDA